MPVSLSMPRHSPRTRQAGPAKGVYSNYFEVGHTAFEVVIDFGQTYAGKRPAPCHTRIVMSPVYAQALLQTLEKALADYQHQFGKME
jgi:hypothetical protein